MATTSERRIFNPKTGHYEPVPSSSNVSDPDTGSSRRTPLFTDFGKKEQPQSQLPQSFLPSSNGGGGVGSSRIDEKNQIITSETAPGEGTSNITKVDPGKEHFLSEGIGSLKFEHYMAALGVSLGGAGGGVSKGTEVGKTATQTTISGQPGFVVNVKTYGQVTSYVAKIIAQLKKPQVIAVAAAIAVYTAIKESRSGEVLGKFVGMEEAAQMVGMPKWLSYEQAQETGEWDLYYQARELENALYADQDMWDAIVTKIPWANALAGLDIFRRTGIAVGAIWDEMALREQNKQNTEQTDEEYWAEVAAAEVAADKAEIERHNKNTRSMTKWKQRAERDGRIEEARFWAKEADKERAKEAGDRKAIADFWIAYRKQVKEVEDNNRPSKLNFGLL